jgi:hypothetical protein
MFLTTTQVAGQLIQITGIVIILASQAVFVWKAHKQYKNFRIVFLKIAAPRVAMDDKDLDEIAKDKEKTKKAIRDFPLAELLYQDFTTSVFGFVITLVGLMITLI